MKVGELREAIKDLDDNDDLTIRAPNAPPWITEFLIAPVPEEEEE